jgi:hypothetical protein
MLGIVPSTVNVLQRVELLSLKLIKQGYVVPKVKYLKCCILYQRKLPFVFTGSFGRGEELVSFLSQFALTNNIGNFSQYAFSNNKEISLKIASSFHALLTYLKRRDRYA